MERKLQVFISSTYIDLQEERQAAVQAILNAGHIPAGMELFKAGNNTQLEVIQRWIDESDVYMLILGGRYGSIDEKTQKSYTQLEYEYALRNKKPVFAVVLSDSMLHKKASTRTDISFFEKTNIEKYNAFKDLVLSKIVRFVDDAKDIEISILSSLYDFSKNPTLVGWVRELIPDPNKKVLHKCYKCGKEELLHLSPNYQNGIEEFELINQWHKIKIDTPQYGSELDTIKLDFEICDKCLVQFVNSLKLKELIFGDDYWYPTENDYNE